ncbi:hypothetical protein BHE74_00021194 [Ensete ventricosum]|nr:hypothetical protein BHE74_00021194 [Ensete ventricosum]
MTDVGRAWTPKEAGRHEFRWPRAERERKPRDGAPRAQIGAGTLKRARRDSCKGDALPANSMGGRRRTKVLRAARSIAKGFRGEFKISKTFYRLNVTSFLTSIIRLSTHKAEEGRVR